MSTRKTPSKAILCLHGAGSSASIFKFQLASLRSTLKGHFDYIFVDAPCPSIAGPGMLPVFANAAPFYRWFDFQSDEHAAEMERIHTAISDAICVWEASRSNTQAEIVGIMGFSQGAVAATLLLWQQQLGQLPWLPRVQFAVLICCDFTAEVGAHMLADARQHGKECAVLDMPTLHLQGRQDPYLPRGRRMVAEHFGNTTQVVEFEGGHACPKMPEDCARAREAILCLAAGDFTNGRASCIEEGEKQAEVAIQVVEMPL